MNCLYDLSKENIPASKLEQSQLQTWIMFHGSKSLELCEQMREERWEKPLTFMANTCVPPFRAFIDPENQLTTRDKLSQVNMNLSFLLRKLLPGAENQIWNFSSNRGTRGKVEQKI